MGERGKGWKWKGQRRRRPYNTCRREKAEKVLELVLVCLERALRILCRKLCFHERLFDQCYNILFYGLAWVFLIFSFFCKLGISGQPLHVTNAFGEILVVHLEGTSY
jgi:hypothetical protein